VMCCVCVGGGRTEAMWGWDYERVFFRLRLVLFFGRWIHSCGRVGGGVGAQSSIRTAHANRWRQEHLRERGARAHLLRAGLSGQSSRCEVVWENEQAGDLRGRTTGAEPAKGHASLLSWMLLLCSRGKGGRWKKESSKQVGSQAKVGVQVLRPALILPGFARVSSSCRHGDMCSSHLSGHGEGKQRMDGWAHRGMFEWEECMRKRRRKWKWVHGQMTACLRRPLLLRHSFPFRSSVPGGKSAPRRLASRPGGVETSFHRSKAKTPAHPRGAGSL